MEKKGADYLVLGMKSYNFVNKDTGEVIAGTNVHYIDLLMSGFDSNTKGYVPLKISCAPRVIEQFTTLPGLYNLDFRQKPGANGKASLVLANAEFISTINLAP